MEKEATAACFRELAGEKNVRLDEPMERHTTFRIGGSADYFVTPDSVEAVQNVVAFCRDKGIPYFILGNGSNLLVSDKGYSGAVIQLFHNFNEVTVEGTCIKAQAGALLSKTARAALDAHLTGLEFAAGIPGTAGGAVVMNAGAYGGEMKQVVTQVTLLDETGTCLALSREELKFGYRTSVLKERPLIALEVQFQLQPGDAGQIAAKMEELQARRISRQPLEFPSAGSTFKRPEGYYAGQLIMDAGFRGYQIGGARVSDKHCGFVVNAGKATAADVLSLTEEIRTKVQEQTGVELELEICRLGDFS